MSDKPSAEVEITEHLVRALLDAQARPTLGTTADAPLTKTAEGWDNEVWRLGEELAVRLPRRALAAPLVLNEQRVLPVLAPPLAARGVAVPLPVIAGRPHGSFPWPWSVVPWIHGDRALDLARSARARWAASLAAAMRAIHTPAPADHPVNPVRGVPLAARDAAFRERAESLRAGDALAPAMVDALIAQWDAGLRAAPWSGRPVWIHGDLHPGNLVVGGGRLRGVIDFGDVTAGDPAYDLAAAWLCFDAAGRRVFDDELHDEYGAATRTRARAWAAAVAMMLLAHSDDNPDYARLGSDTAHHLCAAPST